MSGVRVVDFQKRQANADVAALIADLQADASRISSIVVGYVLHPDDGAEAEITSHAAGDTIERLACAAMVFREETES